MLRALLLATLVAAIPSGVFGQSSAVLHLKVVLVDAEGKPTPVPRHALLISDNPPTAAPRRVVTSASGTADLTMRPGSYTVESDQPVAFLGKAYQWTRQVVVTAGRDVTLELTAGNAEVGPITASATPFSTMDASPLDADPSAILMQWRGSVVALWTPTDHASGLVIDRTGLIATNQRVVGTATAVEVQLTPTVKVTGRVLVADAARDVAIIRIAPPALPPTPPAPLGCGPAKPPLANGQVIFTIGTPPGEDLTITSGVVSGVAPEATVADLMLASGSSGGPVIAADGGLVGITSIMDERDGGRPGKTRIVRADAACDALASMAQAITDGAPPDGTHLPVEPAQTLSESALRDAAQHRAGSLNPYEMSSSDFDIRFITPVMVYAAQHQSEQAPGRPEMDFGEWSDYVAAGRPLLFVRVTPKLTESLWTTLARGAALTQGVALPAFKRFRTGFLRMRVFCGAAEVTPIHPFILEQRVSETQVIDEGLYVFDPAAFSPSCGTVKLVLFSQKEPDKGDERIVYPSVIRQIAQEFTP